MSMFSMFSERDARIYLVKKETERRMKKTKVKATNIFWLPVKK